MRKHKYSDVTALVVFTLMAQLAVGLFWITCLIYWWAVSRVGSEKAGELTSGCFLIIIPLMVLALLVSLLHLGTPRNAWRAVANLRTSWLSREIIFTLLFTLLTTIFFVLHWQGIGAGWLRMVSGATTAAVGSLALYSMIRLYMLRTVPAWNSWLTPAAFMVSTLLLGSLAVGVGLAFNPEAQGDLLRIPMGWIGLVALLLLGIRAVITVLSAAGQEVKLLIVQTSLLVFALSLCSMLLYQSAIFELSGRGAALNWLVMLAFLAVLAEEILARWLFYRSFERVGI